MKPQRSPGSLNPLVREEAVEWFVAFCEEEIGPRACQEFNDWLRKSPEHVRAYLRIAAFWEDAEDLKRLNRHGIEAIVQRALAETNVVSLGEGYGARVTDGPEVDRRSHRLPAMFAALAATVAGVGLISWLVYSRSPTYSTSVGEQRTLTLRDGSTVELNARSRIVVRYSGSERDLDLTEGQALFRVAKDPSRPFLVHSGGTLVRAVGTQFDVYKRHDATVVTVVEGRVAVSEIRADTLSAPPGVSPPSDTSQASADVPLKSQTSHEMPSVLVSAGEQIVATDRSLPTPQPANAAVATAWTQGKLVFDSAPLQEVLEEFNRYLPRPLVIEDAQLLNIHISGVFSVTESRQFVEFLHERFGTTSREVGGEIRIVRP
jgi:transmembrane sensor